MSQVTRSLPWVFKFLVLYFMALEPADGISWLAVPDEHINVEQGRSFSLHWHYKMDDNEKFLASQIGYFVDTKPHPTTMASRDGGENTYHKYERNDPSFSIFGKNNVTLMVRSAAVGHDITYCCEVVWRSTAEKPFDRKCSKVFVYAAPQIIFHIPQLSCKQGDSIKLHCNTTGFPSPQVEWIHDDTHQRIGSSSHISLNITGKRSGGRYCCVADNGFGRDTACTVVNVTEYEPNNTTLSVKQTKRDNSISISINCSADASPPSRYFIMTIDDKEYNSSDGLYTIKVPAARKDKIYHIAVTCIPFNKYGQGPIKKVVFPVYGLDETTPTALKPEIIAVICIVVGGLVVVAAVCLWRRIKTPKVKNMDENTSEDPIDAVDLGLEGPLSPGITSIETFFAKDEECGVPTSLNQALPNEHPAEEEPLYESCVSLKL